MKNKLCCTICFLFIAIIGHSQKTINVADHGIVPGKDVTLGVNQLIRSLKGQKNIILYFPKGQYEFYPENAVEMYRAVTNHDNSLRKLAFPIFNFENFTLDGNGSTFRFHGKISPVTVEGSSNTTLKNFKIDWEHSFVNELKVLENNLKENSFVAEVNSGKFDFEVKNNQILFNHYDWQDVIGQNIAFDPKTKSPIWQTRGYHLKGKGNNIKVSKIDDNKVKFTNITKVTPPVGTIFATYGPSPGGNRFAEAIHLSNSKNNFLENITVYAAGGMAVIAERCENISLNKFIVTSAEGRNMSTRADATHFLGCKGLIKMENCLLEHMMDDGINVHGAYVKVEKRIKGNTFLCEISHPQQWGLIFAEPGDKVMITSRETVLPIYETTVKKVKILNAKRMLITVDKVPSDLPTESLSIENITWYPDLIMKNNIIRQNRARSALISTKGKVVIENNYFSSQMHGILIEGDNKFWYESGGVRDITINNNTFENIGYVDGEGYPLYVSPLFLPNQRLGDQKYHRNIRFTNNTVKSFNGLLVHAKSVKNFEILGNTIEMSKDYPKWNKKPTFHFNYCENVNINENQFKKFTWKLDVDQKDNNTNIKFTGNKGVKTVSRL